MKNNIKQIKTTLLSSASLIHKNPKIIFASFVMSIISLVGRMTDWPILSLAMSLILFSWGYVELDLISQAKNNKKIIWREIPKKILLYLKKTWILIAIGLASIIFAFPILINLYIAYGAEKFQAFISDSWSFSIFIFAIDILTTILSLWFVQSMVILINDNQPALRSIKLAGQFMFKNINLFLMTTLILSLFGLASRTVIELSPFIIITRISYLLFSAYLGLQIKSLLLTNYLK